METNLVPAWNLDTFLPIQQRLAFRFLLGEFCLFTKIFKAAIVQPGFAVCPDRPEAVSEGILREQECDLVYFPSVPPDPQRSAIRRTPVAIRYASRPHPLYYVDLQGGFDEYLQKFSASSRKHLKRDLAKFREHCGGEAVLRVYRSPDEMAAFHGVARAVSRLTYQERLLHAGLPDTPEFVDSLRQQAHSDSVRGYVLFDHERPVAFAYCAARLAHLTYRIIGYDPLYRDLSPGRVLLYLMLEHLFTESRFDRMDFGPGEAFYKSSFATGSVSCMDLYYFRRNLSHWIFILAHEGLSRLSRGLVRAFAVLGVKAKLKQWLRRRASR